MSAIDDIAKERNRQIEVEGWTIAHDDSHRENEIALAAMLYTAPQWLREWFDKNNIKIWPWHNSWWKPTDQRRDLVKAGALIVAEIERLDRAGG